MTPSDAVRETERELAAAGVPDARVDAELLVAHVLGVPRSRLTEPNSLLGPDEEAELRALVGRRASREPLQYVLGEWGFRRLTLAVDRRALIPRPETEVLVDRCVALLEGVDAPRVLDVGTGSGAIALALAVEWTGIEVWATDISPDALAVAETNVAALGRIGEAVRLAQGSWYDALPAELGGAIDVIVSNPPYVAEFEVEDLPEDVRAWEPLDALVSGPTGLEAIERIVADARLWLAQPGSLLVEIAPHQAVEAGAMARAAGFGSAAVWPDLTGRDRILLARA